MPKTAVSIIALLITMHCTIDSGPAVASSPVASISVRPPLLKPCGAIDAKGRRQQVDITEARGRVPRRCGTARTVMRRYLRKAPSSYTGPNNDRVTVRGRTYSCYVSRPDGEGWNYHCNWFSSNSNAFIDYGAGRRF
jgi:hypothetical protein